MREVRLPSGAMLKVDPAPFPDSRALYQALLEEGKGLRLDMNAEVDGNLYKDIFCVGFSSKKIESAIFKCMQRCLYNDLKMTDETFEPEAAREDYFTVLFEVVQENIRPFTKSLYAQFSVVSGMIQKSPA